MMVHAFNSSTREADGSLEFLARQPPRHTKMDTPGVKGQVSENRLGKILQFLLVYTADHCFS